MRTAYDRQCLKAFLQGCSHFREVTLLIGNGSEVDSGHGVEAVVRKFATAMIHPSGAGCWHEQGRSQVRGLCQCDAADRYTAWKYDLVADVTMRCRNSADHRGPNLTKAAIVIPHQERRPGAS
jgi:hypothetical protein